MPALDSLDSLFGRPGVARAVREIVAPRLIYSPVALKGDSLVDALSGLFAQLFAGQASLAGQDAPPRVPLPAIDAADSDAVKRNVRVQAGYDDWYYSMRIHRCSGVVDKIKKLYPVWDDEDWDDDDWY